MRNMRKIVYLAWCLILLLFTTCKDKNGITNNNGEDIGIKLVFHVSRSDIAITQTTNGWDHIGILEEHLPARVDFRIVFVENTSLNLITESGVDIGDYASVSEYFGIIIDKSP